MVSPILHLPDSRKGWPDQRLIGPLTLARGRLHEFCGPARVTLGAILMRHSQGPVVWVLPGWQAERIYPAGLAEFADPGRVIFARARRPEDILWTMEESLRSGAVPLVIGEVLAPPGLTPVRRLHLAAEQGAERAAHADRLVPLGIVMTPGEGGAQGVETRWQCWPTPSGSTLYERRQAWGLRRLRARMAPVAEWRITGHEGELTLHEAPLR